MANPTKEDLAKNHDAIEKKLLNLCRHGTRKTAKADVEALMAEIGIKRIKSCYLIIREMRMHPIHLASFFGNFDIVEFLVEREPTLIKSETSSKTKRQYVNSPESLIPLVVSGMKPMHCAAVSGHLKIVKLLAKKARGLKFRCTDGSTPLHLVGLREHHEVCKFLLENGDDCTLKNAEGFTPIQLCLVFRAPKCMDAMLGHILSTYTNKRWLIAHLFKSNVFHVKKTDKDDEAQAEIFRVLAKYGEGREIVNRRLGTLEPDRISKRQEYPIHACIRGKMFNSTRAMIDLGADTRLEDSNGMNPLEYAKHIHDGTKDSQAIVDYLEGVWREKKAKADELERLLIEEFESINKAQNKANLKKKKKKKKKWRKNKTVSQPKVINGEVQDSIADSEKSENESEDLSIESETNAQTQQANSSIDNSTEKNEASFQQNIIQASPGSEITSEVDPTINPGSSEAEMISIKDLNEFTSDSPSKRVKAENGTTLDQAVIEANLTAEDEGTYLPEQDLLNAVDYLALGTLQDSPLIPTRDHEDVEHTDNSFRQQQSSPTKEGNSNKLLKSEKNIEQNQVWPTVAKNNINYLNTQTQKSNTNLLLARTDEAYVSNDELKRSSGNQLQPLHPLKICESLDESRRYGGFDSNETEIFEPEALNSHDSFKHSIIGNTEVLTMNPIDKKTERSKIYLTPATPTQKETDLTIHSDSLSEIFQEAYPEAADLGVEASQFLGLNLIEASSAQLDLLLKLHQESIQKIIEAKLEKSRQQGFLEGQEKERREWRLFVHKDSES